MDGKRNKNSKKPMDEASALDALEIRHQLFKGRRGELTNNCSRGVVISSPTDPSLDDLAFPTLPTLGRALPALSVPVRPPVWPAQPGLGRRADVPVRFRPTAPSLSDDLAFPTLPTLGRALPALSVPVRPPVWPAQPGLGRRADVPVRFRPTAPSLSDDLAFPTLPTLGRALPALSVPVRPPVWPAQPGLGRRADVLLRFGPTAPSLSDHLVFPTLSTPNISRALPDFPVRGATPGRQVPPVSPLGWDDDCCTNMDCGAWRNAGGGY